MDEAHQALYPRHRHLAVGLQRPGGGARRGAGLLRRHPPPWRPLAAVTILRQALPEVRLRVVNVVDLMKLQPHTEHPHGLTDEDYDVLFTRDKPIIFAFHGYPSLVHELTYRRHNKNIHVRGYREEGHHYHPLRHAGAQRHRPL